MLTVNIETEKAIKAVPDAFGFDYHIAQHPDTAKKLLNKSEQLLYSRLKKTA
ncbi:hypothetical protein [Mucilaginibacter sp.]|uniref:hypothetical protein n=1 Tax=Mucilaginibacter sp. TaxID=1882438 RepID=UPI00262A05AF|nr:hypothetical protein [Mucilaginibacter sp.]MDB4923960.1 hypothetical protein [Mucilaginibacter sp.]